MRCSVQRDGRSHDGPQQLNPGSSTFKAPASVMCLHLARMPRRRNRSRQMSSHGRHCRRTAASSVSCIDHMGEAWRLRGEQTFVLRFTLHMFGRDGRFAMRQKARGRDIGFVVPGERRRLMGRPQGVAVGGRKAWPCGPCRIDSRMTASTGRQPDAMARGAADLSHIFALLLGTQTHTT